MPLVRIDVVKGRTAAQRRSLGDAVHRALVDALGVPAADRFQVIREHEANELNLVETARENWSFGLGEASDAPAEKATA